MYYLLRQATLVAVYGLCFALITSTPAAAQLAIGKDTTKPKMKPYKEVITASAITSNGFFSAHKVNDHYFLEIPDSLLGRDVLVVNRIVKAPAGASAARMLFGGLFTYAGDEISHSIVRFEQLTEDRIFLRTVSFSERSADSSANGLYQSLLNNNVQPIQAAFPIKTVNEGTKAKVIDLTDFINSDNTVLYFAAGLKEFLSISTPAPERSYIESIHAFPMNIEIHTVKTYNGTGASAAAQPRTYELNSSMVLLPKVPMKGRSADPRVGFFSEDFVDFDANPQGVHTDGYIWRWRMEPKPEDRAKYLRGELVEPEHPIVIYIDPLTPQKWVPYLIQGINDWQKALEQAGFKNAIIGKEAPVNDSTWSIEDARHSVLVYKPSDIHNASGPNVHDPRSGEILETHINWYHNVMDLLYKWYFIQTAAIDPRARKPHFDDELMGNLVRFVSSHEIGHTLGLMHNFGASSTVPVDSLRNKNWVEAHGHTPSIMDYARFNYVAQPEDNIGEKGIFPRIGDYDKWAIEWGYRYLPDTLSGEQEKAFMDNWVTKKLASGAQYFYGAQLDPLNPMNFRSINTDPRDQNEDLGDDAVKAGEYGIRNLKRIEPHLLEWTSEPHKNYEGAGEMYKELVTQYGRYMGHVLKNIGGIYVTPKNIDQQGPVFFYPGHAKEQRALAFLHAQLFATPTWLIDQHLFDLATVDFGLVADVQTKTLAALLKADRIARLMNEQTSIGNKAYTLTDMLHDLKQGIFVELAHGRTIDAWRRNLQKQYVDGICTLIGAKSEIPTASDASSIFKAHAKELAAGIKTASLQYNDAVTKAHLADIYDRLIRALNPKS